MQPPTASQPAPALNLHDYLASIASPGTVTAPLPLPVAGYDGFGSPADSGQQNAPVNFADILAEFTLAQNAFSPDANGASHRGGDSSAESTSPNLAPANRTNPDVGGEPAPPTQAKSAQDILLEQLRALYPAAPAPVAPSPNPSPDSVAQSHQTHPPSRQQQFSQVDEQSSPYGQHESTYAQSPASNSSQGLQLGAEMQAQLQQWLAQSMGLNGNVPGHTPTPTVPPAPASLQGHSQNGTAGFHAPAHLQQHQQHHVSPAHYPQTHSPGSATFGHTHSAPASHQASPMPYHVATSRDHQQQYPGSSPATPVGSNYSTSMNSHLPPAVNVPGGAAAAMAALSPFLAGMQPTSPGGSTLQAQLTALQLLVTANAQVQAQAQLQAQSQPNGHQGHQQQQPTVEQQHATPLQQPSNPQTPFDIRHSAPGTANSSYRETDVSPSLACCSASWLLAPLTRLRERDAVHLLPAHVSGHDTSLGVHQRLIPPSFCRTSPARHALGLFPAAHVTGPRTANVCQ